MNQYVQVIIRAAIFFPIVAAIITLPYLIYNYRKRGSVAGLRVPIVYSFILYLICCYFLVILPLPSQEYVAKLTGPTSQLTPFAFVSDIIREANLAAAGGWGDIIKSLFFNPAFFQVIMNVLMFIPLGVYLRYYFRFSMTKVVLSSLLLSLFFELTQLSGLYFIYPRGYRLFDVDDLIVNTFGGAIGGLLAIPLAKVLPSHDELDVASYRRSQKVSLLRRLVALFCDTMALCFIITLSSITLRLAGVNLPDLNTMTTCGLAAIGYFALLPIVMNSQTIGHKLTRLKIVNKNERNARWYQHIGRVVLALAVFVFLPYGLTMLVYGLFNNALISDQGAALLLLIIPAGYLFFIMFELIRVAMHKQLFYERWTGTRLISTTSIKTDVEDFFHQDAANDDQSAPRD